MNAQPDPSSTLDDQLDELAGDFRAPDAADASTTGDTNADADADETQATGEPDTARDQSTPDPAATQPDPGEEDDLRDDDAELAGDFQTPGEVDEDLTGEQFAAQVQAMLDEADLLTDDQAPDDPDAQAADNQAVTPPDDATTTEPDTPAAESSESDPRASADANPPDEPPDPQAEPEGEPDTAAETESDGTDEEESATDDLLNQIDDMLADAAGDDLGGEFDSLETIEGLDEDEAHAPTDQADDLPPHPDVLTGKADPESVAPEAADAPASTADDGDDADQPDEDDPDQSAAMNRLAEELDEAESEAFAARMQGKAVLDPDDPEPPTEEEQAAQAAAAKAKAPKSPAKPRRDPRQAVLTTLARINAPINKLGPDLRAAVGLLALGNLFFGVGLLLVAALFG